MSGSISNAAKEAAVTDLPTVREMRLVVAADDHAEAVHF